MAAVAAANPSAAAIAPPSASAPPAAAEAAESVRQFRLERETELRVEVEWDAKLTVKLVSGTAEIFGSEIAVGQNVTFDGGEKLAVFTWHGCSLEVRGSPTLPDAMYAADETPMVSYLNLHAVLNVRRVEAARSLMRAKQQLAQLQQQQQLQYQHQQRQQQHPHHQQQYQHQLQRLQRHKQQLENKINSLVLTKVPRVLLVGPTDSGKSTLARMLLCWAARQQWHPTYVDLDVAHSSVTVPGAVAATPVEAPLEANARTVEEAPLVLFYGHTNPSANLDLYRALVTALADATDRRLGITPLGEGGGGEGGLEEGGGAAGAGREAGGGAAAIGAAAIGAVPVEAAAAGIIANSMGWVDGAGYQVCSDGAGYQVCADGAGYQVCADWAGYQVSADGAGYQVCADGAGYQLLLHSIDALRANVVLVLGQVRLCELAGWPHVERVFLRRLKNTLSTRALRANVVLVLGQRLYSMPSEQYRSKAAAAAATADGADGGAAMHQPCISHASVMHQPCISHASAMHQPCISHAAAVEVVKLLALFTSASDSPAPASSPNTPPPPPISPFSSSQERLYSMLSEHYRSKAAAAAADGTPAGHAAAVEVVKLVRSGGAVSRPSKFRQRLRQAVVKAYFYGPERQFSPHSSTASWSEYTVLRVGGGPQAPQSALPIGAARVSDPLRTAPVVLSRELEHHVLAVSHAKEEKDAVTG
ncbi:unnamed protein product [Closterium sp. Naga37s-1]|nr:unnamed protein product [Closterium sp. Naga37s-1]